VNRDTFWALIAEHVTHEEGEPMLDALESALAVLPPAEIAGFDATLREVLAESFGWPLWGAAYLINGGCSDDGFEYFRGWLVAMGREAYEAALRDPDSLAKVIDGGAEFEVECEEMLHVAQGAYEGATGEALAVTSAPYPELGEGWDFDDEAEMRRRYPKLAAVILG
jgi:Protein of unknown function (DUF4240)